MKKIPFNDQYRLTQAVLEGLKTNTRRVIPEKLFHECRTNGFLEAGGFNSQWKEKTLELLLKKSPYKIGEEVAIAQRYEEVIDPIDWVKTVIYKQEKGWNNKMFVRADLMPHRIKITNVRVERLKDITNEDCMKEGIIHHHAYGDRDHEDYGFGDSFWFTTPRKAFAALIDKTCGRGTWDSNPWVFVYDFKLIK